MDRVLALHREATGRVTGPEARRFSKPAVKRLVSIGAGEPFTGGRTGLSVRTQEELDAEAAAQAETPEPPTQN